MLYITCNCFSKCRIHKSMCCPLKNWHPKARFHVSNTYKPVSTLQNSDILSWGCKPPSPSPFPEPVSPPNPHILLLPGASQALPHAVPEHSWAPVSSFVPDFLEFLSRSEITQGFCTSFHRTFPYLPFCSLQRLLFTRFLPQPGPWERTRGKMFRRDRLAVPCWGFGCSISAPSLTNIEDL